MKKHLLKTILLLFALVVGSSSTWADTTASVSISDYASAQKWSNGTAYSSVTIDSYVSASGVTGGNNNKYYSSNNSWRHYEGDSGAITISVTGGNTLKSITFTYANGNSGVLKYSGSNVSTGECTDVEGETSATFSVGHSSGTKKGNVQITAISVTYAAAGPTTYSVTYNANGGTGTMTDSNSPYAAGAEVTLLSNTFTAPAGKNWSSWAVTDASSNAVSVTDGKFTMPSSNVTVTAQWVDAPASDYITVSPTTTNVVAGGGDADFTITTDQTLDEDPTVFYTTSTGDFTTTKPAWIEALYDEGTLLVSVAANTGAARTAYFRVEKGSVKSDVITINQAAITVETPTFSPVAGTYTSTQSVTLACETDGATIYYTTDGSTPTSSSTSYTGAISVSSTTTIKAIAIKNGVSSDVASATYTIYPVLHAGTAVDPYTVADARNAIDAAGKTTVSSKHVTGIVSQVDSYNSTYKSITYWISDDGTTTNQFEVYGGLSFDGGTAFSSKNDIQVGDVVVVVGNITYYAKNSIYEFAQDNHLVSQKLVAPTFYPAAGGVGSGTELTISDLHTDATIYYTIDGNDPTTSSTEYDPSSKPTITDVITFKAIAVKTGEANDNFVQSDVASASYTLLAPVETPEITLAEGTYTSAQTTTITCDTEGATIYYTTNGTNPTTSSTEYSGAISINESMTIKAIAAKDGMANSAIAEATYTINIPVINADAVNLAYDATEGSIAYTMTNPVEGGELTAEITAGNEGSWLTLGAVSASAVALTSSENDGEEDRTATVTLTYTYDTDKTVTKAITITQTGIDFATLPFKWDDTSTPTGVTKSSVGTYGTSPYLKFDATDDNIILKIAEIPGTLSFDIKGNSFSGGTFKVQTSADGSSYTDLKSYTSLSSKSTETFNLAGNVRYVKWIYTNKSNGNVALGNIILTKTNTITLAEACTDGSKYYGTYSLGKAFVVPEGLTVSTVGLDNEGKLKVTEYSTGDVVKANTGVLVSATTAGAKTVTVSAETGSENDGNLLKASGDAGITAVNMAEDDTKFYRLTMHNGTDIGFWWGAAEGAAFSLAANKAYLAVPSAVSVKGFSLFSDDETGITEVAEKTEGTEKVFDLSGRRVVKPTKGLYIVNGKKYIKK